MAAPLQGRPAGTTTTASTSTVETARGTHVFKIDGYSLHEARFDGDVGGYILSDTFAVGGYEWGINYYPDGEAYEDKGYVSIFLDLLTLNCEVLAQYDFFLVNQATGLRRPSSGDTSPTVFDDAHHVRGIPRWKMRGQLAAPYLVNDSLVVECDVTVIKEPRVVAVADTAAIVTGMIQMPPQPPSDSLSDNLAKLLETEEESDVTFTVEGEAFPAHRLVLAARSPVFKQELYGPMRDANATTPPVIIAVEDMQPAVFKALLHFIYTDSMPSMADLHRDDSQEMVKHLLVAADRYAVERLRLTCEGILRRSLDVDTVAATLALADQHHCNGLKEACIEFINSSGRTEEVVLSQGYMHLKRSCPSVIADIFERATKSRKF